MQIDTPFAEGTGKLFTVGIHRRTIAIIIGQTQIIYLIRKLIQLKDDAVIIHLRYRRKAGDIISNCPANGNQTRVIHIRQAGVCTFQQRCSGRDVLIAPQLPSGEFHQKIGLSQQPGFSIAAGNGGDLLLDFIQLFCQRFLLTIRLLKLYSLLLDNAFQLGFLALLGFLQCRKLVSQGIAGGGLIDGLLFTPAIQTDARRQSNSDSHRAENQCGIVLTLFFCCDRL